MLRSGRKPRAVNTMYTFSASVPAQATSPRARIDPGGLEEFFVGGVAVQRQMPQLAQVQQQSALVSITTNCSFSAQS